MAYIENSIAYLKDYHVSSGPETVASLGIKYNSPKYWWVSLNANYMANMYFDVNPYNHTEEGMLHYAQGDIRIEDVLRQTPMKDAFTLDFYGGFSKRYKGYYFLVNVSVNNLLNNKNTIPSIRINPIHRIIRTINIRAQRSIFVTLWVHAQPDAQIAAVIACAKVR